MKVFTNPTSPYARIARIALLEKGHALDNVAIVNPWSDDPELNAANSAARVPTVLLDSGLALTESLLIVLWLEKVQPVPSFLSGEDGTIGALIAAAGTAMGVIDAAAQIVTGRMQWDSAFGEHRVGLRRRRTILAGLQALELTPPVFSGTTPDLAVITSVVALDYVKLRFADASWLQAWPNLEGLRHRVADRPAFASTEPHL